MKSNLFLFLSCRTAFEKSRILPKSCRTEMEFGENYNLKCGGILVLIAIVSTNDSYHQ
ncbi:hypothetical protein M2101_000329 [Parabacteroides sp. PM5-20]|nr:hypothetical protein [Parabacteroides sp. PM5-20]